jgi:polysaccharide export outer membrane protein
MKYMTIIGLLLSVGGCGIIYHSPEVREGPVDGGKVRVVDVTPQTVMVANRQPYQPLRLPAAFSQSSGSGTYGIEAAPSPVYLPESRPEDLVARLPPPVPTQPYRIGVGDVVILATKTPASTVEQLTGLLAAENNRQGYTIQDDGSIAVPDVGRVRIAEMTLEEAESVLFQRLLERQIDPSFSLEVAEFNARKASIGGAVVRPGVAPITLVPLTLDNAIATVGGIDAADRDTAVIRIYRDGSLYQVPVKDFLASPRYQKIRLADGDSVFVDTEFDLAKAQAYFEQQIRLAEFRQQNRSNALQILSQEIAQQTGEQDTFNARLGLGAEQRDYVYLNGEVRAQGRWPLPYERMATLADALYDGGTGAPTVTGNPKEVYVLRGSPDPREFGGITAWHVDASSAIGMAMMTRLELRPNDIVFVAEQPVTRWGRVVTQISPSLLSVSASQIAQ